MTEEAPEPGVALRRDLTAVAEHDDESDAKLDARLAARLDAGRGSEADALDEVDADESDAQRLPREPAAEAMLQRIAQDLLGESPQAVLIGRFRVLEILGEGGMGIVYAAEDTRLHRQVAIKAIRGDRLRVHPGERARLLREARAMARLSHPNVVQVHEVDEDGPEVFVVMELVRGTTLGQWLKAKPRTLAQILECFIAAGRGLDAAHQVGIVHRDFKPSNALVGMDGRVRIVDFGLARGDPNPADTTGPSIARGETSSDNTLMTAAEAGTPAYMSPEQILGVPCDARSDQFSFCVALYEAIHGKRPFAPGQLAARLEAKDTSLPELPPGPAPRWLRRVLSRALALRPDDRYPAMADLLTVLETVPRRRRRVTWVTLAGLALAGAVTADVHMRASAPALCPDFSERLDDIWAGPQRAAVERAFSATGLSYARTAAKRVIVALDNYRDTWVESQQEACIATQIRGERSVHALDQSAACLERARRSLTSLTDVLVDARAAVVGEAEALVAALPEPDACLDLDALEPAAPPVVRGEHPELEKLLDRARILERTRQGSEAVAVLEQTITRSQELADPSSEAEALLLLGRTRSQLLRDPTRAQTALEHAHDLAMLSRRDDLLSSLWSELAWLSVNELDDLARARVHLGHARSARARTVAPEIDTTLLALESQLFAAEGFPAEAIRGRHEVLKLVEARPRPPLVEVIRARNGLATALSEAENYAEARRQHEELWAKSAAELGADHPLTAHVEMNLGLDLYELGDRPAASRHLRHARTAVAATYGASSPWVASMDLRLAQLDAEDDKLDDAITQARASLKTFELHFPRTHRDRITALEVLSELYLANHAPAEQLAVSLELLALHETPGPHSVSDPVVVLINISELLCDLGRCEEAVPHVNRLLTLSASEPGLSAFPAFGFGRIHMARGELAQARPFLETAFDIFQTYPLDRPGRRENLAAAARNLADALAGLHRDPKRVRSLRQLAVQLEHEPEQPDQPDQP